MKICSFWSISFRLHSFDDQSIINLFILTCQFLIDNYHRFYTISLPFSDFFSLDITEDFPSVVLNG